MGVGSGYEATNKYALIGARRCIIIVSTHVVFWARIANMLSGSDEGYTCRYTCIVHAKPELYA